MLRGLGRQLAVGRMVPLGRLELGNNVAEGPCGWLGEDMHGTQTAWRGASLGAASARTARDEEVGLMHDIQVCETAAEELVRGNA